MKTPGPVSGNSSGDRIDPALFGDAPTQPAATEDAKGSSARRGVRPETTPSDAA